MKNLRGLMIMPILALSLGTVTMATSVGTASAQALTQQLFIKKLKRKPVLKSRAITKLQIRKKKKSRAAIIASLKRLQFKKRIIIKATPGIAAGVAVGGFQSGGTTQQKMLIRKNPGTAKAPRIRLNNRTGRSISVVAAAPVNAPIAPTLSRVQRREFAEAISYSDLPALDLVIEFEYNSAELTPRTIPVLVKLGMALRDPELAGSTFLVGGHTDATGSDYYNLMLSEARAASVRNFLLQTFGLSPDNLVAVGFGEERLKNRWNPASGENRRVQLVNLSE